MCLLINERRTVRFWIFKKKNPCMCPCAFSVVSLTLPSCRLMIQTVLGHRPADHHWTNNGGPTTSWPVHANLNQPLSGACGCILFIFFNFLVEVKSAHACSAEHRWLFLLKVEQFDVSFRTVDEKVQYEVNETCKKMIMIMVNSTIG